MVNRHTALKIRKTHRYLGIFLGLQFLLWTISGLYFSWTNIDKIHGDQFKKANLESKKFNHLISVNQLSPRLKIASLQLRNINDVPYYWINNRFLYHAISGKLKEGISKEEALTVAERHLVSSLKIKKIELISTVGKHHEYREKLLPAYVISYKGSNQVKAYISQKDGSFQTVRHKNWRWFDFLWMMHTMDYEGRDNINTLTLRIFSLIGLITVFSGFLLWFTSSTTIRKIQKIFRK